MSSFTNNTANGENKGIQPKITLYTNHACPFAHRAHIVLHELGMEYEEVIIDLEKPREEWWVYGFFFCDFSFMIFLSGGFVLGKEGRGVEGIEGIEGMV